MRFRLEGSGFCVEGLDLSSKVNILKYWVGTEPFWGGILVSPGGGQSCGFRFWGSGFNFGVENCWFRLWGLRCRVSGSLFRGPWAPITSTPPN